MKYGYNLTLGGTKVQGKYNPFYNKTHTSTVKDMISIRQLGTKRENSTSKFHGVSLSKRDNKWIAQVYWKGKIYECGKYKDEYIASLAYDCRIYSLSKNKNLLNFPKEESMNFDYSLYKPKFSSRFVGVNLRGSHRWSAHIAINNHQIILGCFDTEIEAALVRDNYCYDHFKFDRKLNFIKLWKNFNYNSKKVMTY